ncbi:MAG: patatin-like phospholipase family protein [Methylococcales bacterium]
MSSGFFGFFAHLGCLETLEESGLAPAGISGSSAGALAGAIWASGCTVSSLKKRLFSLMMTDFCDPAPGLGLLQGSRFRNIPTQICPVARIEECRVPLASGHRKIGPSKHSISRKIGQRIAKMPG